MNTLPMLQWNIAPFYVRGSQEAGGGLPDPSLDGECRDFRVADVYLLAGHDCACTMLVVAGQLATQSPCHVFDERVTNVDVLRSP